MNTDLNPEFRQDGRQIASTGVGHGTPHRLAHAGDRRGCRLRRRHFLPLDLGRRTCSSASVLAWLNFRWLRRGMDALVAASNGAGGCYKDPCTGRNLLPRAVSLRVDSHSSCMLFLNFLVFPS